MVASDQPAAAAGSLALVEEVRPRSALESMLATQAVAVHNAAMALLARATQDSDEYADRAAACAGRLGRLFLDQLEALARLRGKPSGPAVTVGQSLRSSAPGRRRPGGGRRRCSIVIWRTADAIGSEYRSRSGSRAGLAEQFHWEVGPWLASVANS
jgi:hypothetical protein